jgi:uncharacterized repeat protein (TIGR02543 family)
MKKQTKTLMALASVCLLMAGAGVTLITSADESDALVAGDWEYTLDSTSLENAKITKYNGAGGAVTIPSDIGGHVVIEIGQQAFYQRTDVTSITIPETVKTLGVYAFAGSGITSVVVPESVTEISSAFNNCTSLTSATITASTNYKVFSGPIFKGCTNLVSVEFGEKVLRIGEETFKGCTNLTTVLIPGVNYIDNYTFEKCTSLTSIAFGHNVTTIGENAFKDCTALTSVTIPNTVSQIFNSAFQGCTALTSVTIPDSVTKIYSYAFYGCTNLATANVPNTTTINSNAFGTNTELIRYDSCSVTFDSTGGNAIPSMSCKIGDVYGDLPVPTREGYRFDGWYYTEGDGTYTGPVGSDWTAFMNLTMWAKWTPLLEVPYTAPSGSAVANVNWSYTPTSESGVTVTVSGVDWLSVNGTSVYGVPPAPGEYTITIGMSKPGYSDRTETIVLNVVSELIVFNSPLSGAIIYGL